MEYATRVVRKHSFILFFAVFGLIVLGVYVFSLDTTQQPLETSDVSKKNDTVSPEINFLQYTDAIKNASIIVPDTTTRISLVDGRASYGTMLDGGDVAFVKLVGGVRLDTNTSHVFADIVVQSGGTGAFHYICIFKVTGDRVTYMSSYFIGDRVDVSTAMANDVHNESYDMVIEYLDRDISQAMSEDPTVSKSARVPVKKGVFVEETL